ncbi:MAG TPA: MaoC family dehydratase [Stellaceae bacterium]|nr:MaoC family dehydratase [Stellaceae bacterium]
MHDVRDLQIQRAGYALEDLAVGMTAAYRHTLTDRDIHAFADLTGDHNPLHLNEDFARQTRFKGRIAHGMLSASFFSTVLAILPGPGTIYLGQTLAFKAPVRIGDTVEARATIMDILPEKARVRLKTVCTVGETVVIDGEATAIVPRRG